MSDFPIVTKLGGRLRVSEALAARGLPKSKDAIRMWTARDSIPGKAMAVLLALAHENGIPYDPADYRADCSAETSEAA